MDVEREVIKSSWLQQKTCRICGTILRKKKVHYEEAEWVVLCMHDKQLPLLEWYFNEDNAQDHRPNRVVHLLEATYVTPEISDPRSFVIGFVNSPESLELSALSSEDCQDWVQKAVSVLEQLNFFGNSSNIYCALPDVSCFPVTTNAGTGSSNSDENGSVPQAVAPLIPDTNNVVAVYQRLSLADSSVVKESVPHDYPMKAFATNANQKSKKTQSHEEKVLRPPLPPRSSQQISSPNFTGVQIIQDSTYDSPKNLFSEKLSEIKRNCKDEVKGCNSGVALDNSHEYGSISEEFVTLSTVIPIPCTSPTVTPPKNGYSVPKSNSLSGTPDDVSTYTTAYDTLCPHNSRYDRPLFVGKSYSTSLSTRETDQFHSTTVEPNNCVLKSEEFSTADFSTLKRPFLSSSDLNIGVQIKNTVHISLERKICLNHVAFVDFYNRVWIGGWTAVAGKCLSNMIHIGDEVLQVMGKEVENVNQVMSIISNFCSEDSSASVFKVDFTLRQLTYGREYTLVKSGEADDLGITLQKHKNKIESVREGSPAYKAGIRAKLSACTRSGTSSAAIVQINGHQLSIFARNDEFLLKLKEIPSFCSFTVAILPHDFVKMIKRNLKKLKNFDEFQLDR